MVVFAVHFEATGSMDTTHVINALSRFCDQLGVPDTITSDNQTSFHKADKELTDCLLLIGKRFDEKLDSVSNPGQREFFGSSIPQMLLTLVASLKSWSR
jgi:hypothetical protein